MRATGRTEEAERLERRREQVGRAADEVEAGVSKTQPQSYLRPDYWVPAVADGALEPPSECGYVQEGRVRRGSRPV